ncbi:MAG: M48 family metalloprotease [Methanomassiliicoccales archaeon]
MSRKLERENMGPRAGVAVLFLALMTLFVVIGAIVGFIFFGNPIAGALVFLILSAVINLVAYFFATPLVLRSNRAKYVTENEQPRLYSIVREVSNSFGLPMPKVAVASMQTPNAFATGRNPKNAVVCATQGILNILNDNELRGVIAHEMAHVKDRDVLVMSIAATIAGAISYAANSMIFAAMFGGGGRNNSGLLGLIVMAVTVPIAAAMLQLAISRRRELEADLVGARTIGDPLSLASALEKLEYANMRMPPKTSPATSSLYIVNSPGRFRNTMFNLMSTHPPIEVRIKRLQRLAYDMGLWAPDSQWDAARTKRRLPRL